jgi:hypothetical protein
VHRAWVYKLKARYEAEGEAALEPRSRRPKTSPNALDPAVVALILELRDKLSTAAACVQLGHVGAGQREHRLVSFGEVRAVRAAEE